MTAALYHRKLERALERMGGAYTLNDILTAIGEGKMQSFAVNNSWAITQLLDFPQARQLHVLAAVGDLADMDAMHAKLLDYAREADARQVTAYGRLGWIPEARARGWRLKAKSYLYQRDL